MTTSTTYTDPALSERARRMLGDAADGSPAGDLTAALDEIERLQRLAFRVAHHVPCTCGRGAWSDGHGANCTYRLITQAGEASRLKGAA